MKYKYALCGTIVLLLFLGGCGPSAEQIATMTASAWTLTPLPTATPTPLPKAGSVTLFGNVYDAVSNNGIAEAYVFVLKSGISYDAWANNNYSKGDIYSYTQTDSNGNYRVPDALQRNTKYTVIASVEGYYDQYGEDLIWTDQDPAEYELNIGLKGK